MEKKITFISEGHEIEGLFNKASDDKGVVVTHPHPLYGGDMHNYVVESVVSAYLKKGYSTLRFNFRGTGRSQGSYGDGIGEQQDVISAISYLFDEGIKQADLAGYSFGAWVNSMVPCKENSVHKMTMVSPPVAFIDFKNVSSIPCLDLVVTGDRDDIAPSGMIKKMLPMWNPNARFEVIKDADHFYSGSVDKLESVL
ncbi:MAG: alpha/beta hydrolase [Desulfobacteraceae bacterium]|nr:alpha/beta hydrolase [Desulfobacteraceae bacterium]